MREIVNVSRRRFLKTAFGGALVLGFGIPFSGKYAHAAQPAGAPFTPSAFLRISPDSTVTMVLNHSEMGQGVYTSLPMLIAEELECDWNKIRLEAAPVDPVYNHTTFGVQATGGSTSVATEWERMRKVGAAAREMLLGAAARTWKVTKKSCRAENGVVYHKSGKKLTYGELSAKAASHTAPN